ncbi:glycosyltransferase [Tessaracoccus antarcticus]|uniref:Glycosyltransferase n=1 Tax=Tessaracoccus antarcticus TaxID=2479848 RepID=A0A3M0G8E1_9ACTN|nr:glycosyltransferase [Tessaracoccus antarcticus]RMB61235.1 glycosyltransferase [Tessaracoccus antarcticus]
MPETDSPSQVVVSVVVPCFRSIDFLPACIATFTAQTLDPDLFETIFVFNGTDDGGMALAEELLSASGLHHQILKSSVGASPARNRGSQQARGSWIVFHDVDDTLSPQYLEALLASATSRTIVPVAGIVDIDEFGNEKPSEIHEQIQEHRGVVDARDLRRVLTLATLKLIPAEVVHRHPFNEQLDSGEDVALFADMADAEGLSFDTTPAHEGAMYRRLVRAGSVGRQGMTFDFKVRQRLDVIEVLEQQIERGGPLKDLIASFVISQASFISRYLDAHPEQQETVVAAIKERDLHNFPWYVLRLRSQRLIVSYNFAPFSDPSSVVALKRAVVSGKKWNVISADMSSVRSTDRTLARLARDAVAEHTMVDGPAVWSQWSGMEDFMERGWTALEELEVVHGRQREVHSRAMWPASHYLGALIKARRGAEVHWAAEFSDPLSTDVKGNFRPGVVTPSPLLAELEDALRAVGVEPPGTDSLFVWAETVAYGLADQIMFTNPHQMTAMLERVTDRTLRERILDRAVVSPQPTLPEAWYDLGRGPTTLTPGVFHIGYFGSFYPTRGMGDVFKALAELPAEKAARIKLHLFTASTPQLAEEIARNPRRSSIIVYNSLPYLDFLRATREFDLLFLNDAETRSVGKRVNPYLPSKLSDYLGSGSPIWAMAEPGSMLSRSPVHHITRLGDVPAAVALLNQLVPGGIR